MLHAGFSEAIDRVLELTRDMTARAAADEWQAAAGIQQRRDALLKKLFSEPRSPEEMAEAAARLREVLRMDQELIRLGEEARERLAGDMRKITRGRRAVHAYTGRKV